MNTKPNDGGPAFPLQDWDEAIRSSRCERGMFVRDWFAGKALEGELNSSTENCHYPTKEACAKACYEYADAMLVARERSVKNEPHP